MSPPEGWIVADEGDEHVSLTHDERDVEVVVEEFEVREADVGSRSDTAPAPRVFEVGYRPPDVQTKSLHVSTVDCPRKAERLMLEAVRALDE